MKKKMKRIIIPIIIAAILLPFVVGAVLLASISFGYEVHRDVSYGERSHEVMDIYIPNNMPDSDECGAVIFIHGGSWMGGDKRDEEIRCKFLASRGYIAATMNYELYSEENAAYFSVDTVMDEIDAAIMELWDFTAERDISLTRVATSGYSAGAHLSMMYSASRADSAPLDVVFSANLAGPADISPEIWGNETALQIGVMLSDAEITAEMIESGEADEILAEISPVTYVDSDTPPMLFVYGGKDTTVKAENGDSLVAALEEHGVEYEYIFMPNSDHSLLQNIFKHLDYMTTLADWCEKYF